MPNDMESELDLAKEFSLEEVMTPSFRLECQINNGTPCRNLYLQTFERSPDNLDQWRSLPADQWHLLACILPDSIAMYPVHTRPYAQRYLNPKHGRFETLIYDGISINQMPETVEAAMTQIEMQLSGYLFDECRYGLGLHKDLETVWRKLALLPRVDTIIVSKLKPTHINGGVVCINEFDLDQLRRVFNRVHRKGRELIKSSKEFYVRNELLASLAPERFKRIVQVDRGGQLLELRRVGPRQSLAAARAERQATVRTVRDHLETLASEAPRDLLKLHVEIERVTLAKMIEKYEEMMQKALLEGPWQRFFEDNIFILTMIFARPVRLLHTQFHAQGSSLDGSGAQVGDFLFAEQGQALAIVEIKKPATVLMLNTSYRNSEVFGPNAELSGAVTQVLYQQSALRSRWLVHNERPEIRASRPDSIKCVVIAGTTPSDEAKQRSFEVFRNACKDVEVITFDELLGKLRLLLSHLNPPVTEANDPAPF